MLIRLLQISSSPRDADAVTLYLKQAGHEVQEYLVDSQEALVQLIAADEWDVVVAWSAAGLRHSDVLAVVRSSAKDLPAIVISDAPDEQAERAMRRAGVCDFVDRDRLARIVPAIERAMDDVKRRRESAANQLSLQESEDRYQRIAAATTDYRFTVAIGDDGTVETRHGATCELITGYRPEEFVADPGLWLKMVVPADRERVQEFACRVGRGESMPPIEHRLVKKDGSVRWIRNMVFHRHDSAGRFTGYDGLIQDITDRKAAEQTLHSTEEKYSRLFYLSPDLLTLSRLEDAVYLEVNDSFLRSTGYSREEVIGRSATRNGINVWADETDRTRLKDLLGKTGMVTGFESQFRRRNGELGTWSISARIIDVGGVPCLMSITRDVTAQKVMESQLRKLSRAVDQSPLSVLITDRDGNIEYVNAGFTRVTGYSAEEAQGRNPRILKSGAMLPADYANLWAMISAGREWRGEFLNKKKNGELYWEDATISGIRDPDGTITHHLAIKVDITAQKEAERKVSEAVAFSQTMIEHLPIGIATYNAAGDAVWVNEEVARMAGTTRENVRSQNFRRIKSWKDSGMLAAGETALCSGTEQRLDANVISTYGRKFWASCRMVPFQFNGEKHLLAILWDITEKRRTEYRREQTVKLLTLCNQASDTRALVGRLIAFFQEQTGCEAVGLRLKEGQDYPYFETRGFSTEFVEAERKLCRMDRNGETVVDAAGKPVLECMCGKLLSGETDSTRPYFTAHGSFWTNSTSALSKHFPEADHPRHARNRCVHEGYESILLIPLRSQGLPIGLLQLNDHRKDLFSADDVAFLETEADYVAIALAQLQGASALRSTEEHLREAVETTEAGYFFLDPEGDYQQVNQAWLRLHGYNRPEEIIGKHFSLTQTEADLPRATALLKELTVGQAVPPMEMSRRCQDGSIGYHTLSAHVVRKHGRVAGAEGFLIDTTSLRQIREQYRVLFEQILDGFALHEMIFGPDGKPVDFRYLAVNPAYEAICGLEAAAITGRRASEVIPSFDRKWIEIYGEVVRTGEPRRMEEFNARVGRHLDVLAFRSEPGRFACLVRDITERKHLEAQLLQAQKMEAIGQLAGGVAHDFNNILAASMMHLSLLQMDAGLSAEVRSQLAELQNESKRAANLTRQLLMFSRRQVMQMRAVEVNEAISNLLKMLRRLIGESIRLDFKKCSQSLWIEADAGMLDQVIVNLSVNARDAMPDGGTLTISLRSAVFGPADIKGSLEAHAGRFVCIEIADTGVGMDAATLKRIFEPFFTTKELGKGTGLGLATVYGIVKQHRGWLEVDSVPRKGSSFRVFLPLIDNTERVEAPSEQVSIPHGHETILVVEDDGGLRKMVAGTLKVLGYRVFECADGREALKIWPEVANEVDLLLTDMVMPEGISGLKLCQEFRRARPRLKVILSTGYSGELVALERKPDANIEYLPKPYTAEQLGLAVRRTIDGAK